MAPKPNKYIRLDWLDSYKNWIQNCIHLDSEKKHYNYFNSLNVYINNYAALTTYRWDGKTLEAWE